MNEEKAKLRQQKTMRRLQKNLAANESDNSVSKQKTEQILFTFGKDINS